MSAETKFTPGPWFVHDFSDDERIGTQGETDVTVSCSSPDHIQVARMGKALKGTHSEALANAHLIAAAPDMYAALLFMSQTVPYMAPAFDMLPVMHALAKARGEA